MTIKQWLSNVYYDEWGTHIWNKEKDGGSQLVADVRRIIFYLFIITIIL